MTARDRVARTRAYLAASIALAAVTWAAAAALAAGIATVMAARVVGAALPEGIGAMSALAALLAAGTVVYRAWPSRSLERVALWVEEHDPTLEFALVTASDRSLATTPALERAAAFAPLRVTRRPITRLLLTAFAALALTAAGAWALAGSEGTRDMLTGRAPHSAAGADVRVDDPLGSIRVTITPPGYSRLRMRTADDPSAITALPGSRIVLTGAGASVTAHVGNTAMAVSGRRGWRVELTMPGGPVALTLRSAERRRVVVLEPIADAAPRVRLSLPRRDTIMQRAVGVVAVAASVEDDIGISDGYVEYMLSSGAEETFSARTVLTGSRDFRGSRRGDLSATIDLGALNLGPGDLISMRAVARDRNNVTGRGVGVSDTRTYRVARRDEYDSLAIEAGAPIVPESTVVSQRMLILRTEALLREQAALTRDSVLKRVRAIAADQIRLRERVHDLVYPAHTHADGEVEAEGEPEDAAESAGPVNPNLRTAYEEMWSASRELQIAEPASALPFMRAAAAALDRARLANRYYLRSGVSRVVVDVPRVRLQGKDRGSSATRAPRPPEAVRREFARGVVRAAALPTRGEAADELSLIRVRALAEFPELAAALQPAIDALRRGRDAGAPLAAVRAVLDGADESRTAAAWSRW